MVFYPPNLKILWKSLIFPLICTSTSQKYLYITSRGIFQPAHHTVPPPPSMFSTNYIPKIHYIFKQENKPLSVWLHFLGDCRSFILLYGSKVVLKIGLSLLIYELWPKKLRIMAKTPDFYGLWIPMAQKWPNMVWNV